MYESKGEVAIIGLGYVGLPLAISFAESGTRVIGIDKDLYKINMIKRGRSYIEDLSLIHI